MIFANKIYGQIGAPEKPKTESELFEDVIMAPFHNIEERQKEEAENDESCNELPRLAKTVFK